LPIQNYNRSKENLEEDASSEKKGESESNYIEKIFSLYQEKSKNLQRFLALLLGFALFFLFIIFLPYISILEKNHDVSIELSQAQKFVSAYGKAQDKAKVLNSTLANGTKDIPDFFENIIRNYAANLNACRKDQNATRMIQISFNVAKEVKNLADEIGFGDLDVCKQLKSKGWTILHFYINDSSSNGKIEPYISFPIKKNNTASPTYLPSNHFPLPDKRSISLLEYYNVAVWYVGSPFWLNNNTEGKINDLFKGYNRILRNITNDINSSTIDIGSKLLSDRPELQKTAIDLQQNLKQLQKGLNRLKTNYTTIIPTEVQKVFRSNIDNDTSLKYALHDKLVHKIEVALAASRVLFKTINGTLDVGTKQLKNITGELNKLQGKLAEKKNETSQRLKDIEFPFGKVPIGLNESVSLFPLGLAIVFLICASLLCDTIRLRKDFDTRYKGEHSESSAASDKKPEVDLIAPLWIEPASPKPYQILKFMIFLIPLIIFVISVYLISYSWNIMKNEEIEGIFVGNNTNNQVVYIGLYVISIAFFIYGYWRILEEIHRY